MLKTNNVTGNLSMLMYVIITVLSSILIHDTNQSVSPFVSAFYTFLFCIVVYGYSVYGLISQKLSLLAHHWLEILILNATTAVCWVFSFLSLKFIPPDLFLFIFICAMPVMYSLIYRKHIIRSILFMLGLVALGMTYHLEGLTMGFVIAFIGGASGAVYSIFSKKLVSIFSTSEILSLRFFLTVLVTMAIDLHFHAFHIMSSHFYVSFAAIALVSVILPLFCYQVGIKYLNVSHVISYLPLAPLLCYLINLFFVDADYNIPQLLAVTFLFSLMMFNFANVRKEE